MTTTLNAATAGAGGLISTADASGVLQLQTAGTAALTIDGSQNVTLAGNITLNNGAADGAQVTLSSSGYSDWNIDNYSGSFRLYNGATERLRLDASGNLGLGVTPSAWNVYDKVLQVGSSAALFTYGVSELNLSANAYYNSGFKYLGTGASTRYQQTAGAHQWYSATSGTAGNAISFTQAMTLDASGNLGIGATSPTTKLTVYGPTTGNIATFSNTVDADFYINCTSGVTKIGPTSGVLAFQSGSTTERARIDSSGNLLVGTTNTSSTAGTGLKITAGSSQADSLSIVTGATTNAGLTTYQLYSTGGGAYRFYVGAGGTVFATSTTISAISDLRFKENVRDLNVGLAEVLALKPRLYDWKEGKGADIKNARGFIAQEFEQVFPDLIDEWRDPAPEGEEPYKSVRQDLIPVLVKAIQEQQALITQLTERITALENK